MRVGGAAEMLRVFEHVVPIARLAGVFALGVHISAANADGSQLVHADPPVEDFLLSGRGIEEPFSLVLDQGDRKRPGIQAKLQLHNIRVGLGRVNNVLAHPAREIGKRIAGLDDIRRNQFLGFRSKNQAHVIGVPGLHRHEQRRPGLLRRAKTKLGRGWNWHTPRGRKRPRRDNLLFRSAALGGSA